MAHKLHESEFDSSVGCRCACMCCSQPTNLTLSSLLSLSGVSVWSEVQHKCIKWTQSQQTGANPPAPVREYGVHSWDIEVGVREGRGGGVWGVHAIWFRLIWSLPEHLLNHSSYVPVQLKKERKESTARVWASLSTEVMHDKNVCHHDPVKHFLRLCLPNGLCNCKPLISIWTKLQQIGPEIFFSEAVLLKEMWIFFNFFYFTIYYLLLQKCRSIFNISVYFMRIILIIYCIFISDKSHFSFNESCRGTITLQLPESVHFTTVTTIILSLKDTIWS